MAGSTVHTCDHDPLVLLPEAVAFPVDVRRVDILKIGRSRVLVPQGGRRDNFFLNWPRVSDDCMVERNQPDAQDWRPMWSPIDRLEATDAVIASAAKQARIAPCSGSARCTWSLRCTRDDCAGRSAQRIQRTLPDTGMRLLDRYLPTYQFSEMHACLVAAEPAAILDRVAAYRPDSDRFFRLMIGLREWPMRVLGKPDAVRPQFGFDDFTLLGRSESEIVYGLVGRFWRPDYGLETIADDAAFVACDATHIAKLALAFQTRRDPDGRTRLVTETRVFCASRAARLKFMPYWLLDPPRQRFLATAHACVDQDQHRSTETVIAGDSP